MEHSACWCQTLINRNVFFVVVVFVWQLPQTQREFDRWPETKSHSCYVHNSFTIMFDLDLFLLYLCFSQCVVTEAVYLLTVSVNTLSVQFHCWHQQIKMSFLCQKMSSLSHPLPWDFSCHDNWGVTVIIFITFKNQEQVKETMDGLLNPPNSDQICLLAVGVSIK